MSSHSAAAKSRRFAHRNSAFTLVELLVVIGIIAILIATLLPALSAARRQAATIKCAAGLKDIGNAMIMYANDNKGYLPPSQVNYTYNVGAVTFNASAPADGPNLVADRVRWFNLLGKYLMRSQPEGAAITAEDMQQQFQKTVIWGCPAYTGYIVASAANSLKGGINRNYPPYAVNHFPGFSAENPPPGSSHNMPWTAVGANNPFQFEGALSPVGGTWFKLVQFKQPAERALLADARSTSLEARAVQSSVQIPGQPTLQNQAFYISSTTAGTTYDFYRHGKYPQALNAQQFFPIGGKVAYNILYADGHVATAVDRETGYRSLRMRFPL